MHIPTQHSTRSADLTRHTDLVLESLPRSSHRQRKLDLHLHLHAQDWHGLDLEGALPTPA